MPASNAILPGPMAQPALRSTRKRTDTLLTYHLVAPSLAPHRPMRETCRIPLRYSNGDIAEDEQGGRVPGLRGLVGCLTARALTDRACPSTSELLPAPP